MAWDGYYEYDGTEIINVARTEAYAMNDGAFWFQPLFRNGALRQYLGQEDYSNPAMDNAPWYDPDFPESEQFYGFYPLSINGVEDSTRQSSVTESVEEGGNAGRVRHATKSVVYSGMYLGATEAAVEYGHAWLRRALLGAECSRNLVTSTSVGAPLRYFSSVPTLPSTVEYDMPPEGTVYIDGGDAEGDDDEPVVGAPGMVKKMERFLHRVVFNTGPTLTGKRTLSCGGTFWSATFTGVAGNPFEFGGDHAIFQGYLDPEVLNPWVPGVQPGWIDVVPTNFTEVPCGNNLWDPIYDPACGAVIVPPGPPSVPMTCFTLPTTWKRRKIGLDKSIIPRWGQVMPVMTFEATVVTRNVRVRFYENPDDTFDPDEAPCAFVGDFVISYIPAGATLVFDAAREEIVVITSLGYRRQADSLVFGTDGEPFDWPGLSCGFGYILTVDVPNGQTPPVIDLSLVSREI